MNEPSATFTIAIIILTVGCSFMGFHDAGFTEQFIFSPIEVLAGKQYYRLVTSAFLHADFNHLLMNMISLYLFGRILESSVGPGQFLLIYFASIVGGGLLSLWLHRNHEYRAYGASGGVCGVIFSYIALNPGGTILAHFFIPIPAWAYGILFLIGSFVSLRRQADNVGHDAHIGGAVIGLWTTGALQRWAVEQNLKWFLILSAVAVALFFYFIKNPMLLPISSFSGIWHRRKEEQRQAAPRRRETRDVDAVLDKISREGMDSLTAEERALLQTVSKKFQSRSQSDKPKSDLII
jgi:membrane associated rhomboid family serine protease